jgi:hypothetical protein
MGTAFFFIASPSMATPQFPQLQEVFEAARVDHTANDNESSIVIVRR